MRKLLTVLMVLSLILSMAVMSVHAEAPAYKAKAGAATIDGKISEGEYGTKYEFNKDNTVAFSSSYDVDPLPFSFYINWTEEGLYIAYELKVEEGDWGDNKLFPQFNMNPWDVLGDDQQGLFFSFFFDAKDKIRFTIHNHGTVGNSEASGSQADLEDIDYAIEVEDDGSTVLEFMIPVKYLQVKDGDIDASDKKLEAGQTWGLSAFLIRDNKGWAQIGAPDNFVSDVENPFHIGSLKLGTITLEEETTPEPEETPAPTDKDEDKDDDTDKGGVGAPVIAAIVIGVIIVAAVVVYFVTRKKDQ